MPLARGYSACGIEFGQVERGWPKRRMAIGMLTTPDRRCLRRPGRRASIRDERRGTRSGAAGRLGQHINVYLIRWAMRKYKRMRARPARANRFLADIARREPGLFAHWQWGGGQRLE